MFNGKIHYKWPFSIAMLVYQRVLYFFSWDNTKFINGWAELSELCWRSWDQLKNAFSWMEKAFPIDFRCFLLLYSITFNLIWCTFETFWYLNVIAATSAVLKLRSRKFVQVLCIERVSRLRQGFDQSASVYQDFVQQKCSVVIESCVFSWSVDFETWTKINGGPN